MQAERTLPPSNQFGKIKSLGVFGTKYEVGQPIRQLDNGDWMMRIKLVETGEEVEYCFDHLKNDPEAK
jgi:hypothetical protein